MSEDLTEVLVRETNNLTTEHLQSMIAKLSTTEDGESLKNEMSKLKITLKQNPAACSMLLPEDIGQMVGSLMRMTNRGILDQLNPEVKAKNKAMKKEPVSQEELDALKLDDMM
jgi:hypothetical protein